MPPQLIVLAPGDVIQITDNNYEQFGDILIIDDVTDDGVNAYMMVNRQRYTIHLKWGEFEYVGRARVIFKPGE